jgi:hypothetical protein
MEPTARLNRVFFQKSSLKRDGPVFFSSSPAKVTGDERTLIAIVAPHRGETNHTTHPLSGGKPAGLPQLKNSPLSANVAIEKSP